MRDLGDELPRWRQFKVADAPPTIPENEFEQVSGHFDTLHAAEVARSAIPAYGQLAVSGSDLIALGLKPGPTIGRILKELEELVIDDPLRNERDYLLTEAKQRIVKPSP